MSWLDVLMYIKIHKAIINCDLVIITISHVCPFKKSVSEKSVKYDIGGTLSIIYNV